MDQVRAVVERLREPAVFDYGPTTIRQLAAIYERCAVWVGNDGGAKHLAVAAGTPTVSVGRWRSGAVWSNTSPGSRQTIAERLPVLDCDRNCGKCPHLSCLEQLTVSDVVGLVRGVLHDGLPRDAIGAAR
jgi:ADP-heptose:LPS heptosyltransferase